MKKLFRRNQVIVTVLAVMIAIAGYLNYADNNVGGKDLVKEVAGEEEQNTNKDSEKILGEDDLIKSGSDINSLDKEETSTTKKGEKSTAANANEKESTKKASNEAETSAKTVNADVANNNDETGNPGDAVFVNNVGANNFAAAAKLNREQVRAKTKETLQAIIDNSNLSDGAKADAIKKMVELTDISARESAAETLLAAKGFENAVVTITDGKVDVAVMMEKISDSQRAQIEDVIKRKTEVSVSNIYITPVKQK